VIFSLDSPEILSAKSLESATCVLAAPAETDLQRVTFVS
jgi:hypothetical protein